MSQPTPEAVLNEFLKSYADDRARGAYNDLDHYLDRFPGHADVIAREFIALSDESLADAEESERIGDFELIRELGRGGQGVVYVAHDTRLNRRVALKVLQAGAGLSGGALERFRREAEVTARLDHPNICTVYDTGTHGGRAYIAMRLIEGEPLDRWTRKSGLPDAADVATMVALVRKVALALHSAHEEGVVHRDVKPANIMVATVSSTSGASDPPRDACEPVITDFGLAATDDESLPTLTRTGDLLGTPAYMSPEQIVHQQAGIDRRTDVYSLGVTLHECLTSERPFSAPTREATYHAILHEPASPPSRLNRAVSRDLDTVVMTAMEKDPARRYQTALDFAEDLARVAAGEPIAARPVGPGVRLSRWRRRNPTVATLLFAAVVVTIAAFAYIAATNRSLEKEQRRTSEALTALERLSDVRRLRELEERAEELWPAEPRLAGDMSEWLSDAEVLLGRLPTHARDLEDVGARMEVDDSVEIAWREEILKDLVGGLETLGGEEGLVPDMKKRLHDATTIERRSLGDHRVPWEATIAAVAAHESYGGLELSPQLGLVPLGPDPDTGLHEFLHLATHEGAIPERDEDDRIRIADRTGMVLVLLPGGAAVVGSDGADADGGNPDPNAASNEYPSHEVALDPFFISKYEVTQGQWQRFTGANPSWYRSGKTFDIMTFTDVNPVTNVDWNTASRELRRMGLDLPTEVQWEYACRAGTDTRFFFDEEDVSQYANLADRAFKRMYLQEEHEDSIDDGWAAHAPVGSFAANPFGLHDIVGNVFEWCRDGISDYAAVAARDGDGYRAGKTPRILRGGSFKKIKSWTRSGARGFNAPTLATAEVGLRPVRTLRE